MEDKDRIIVALDMDTFEQAKNLVGELMPVVNYFKVSLELITSGEAIKVIKFIHQLGGKILYDGKFNDIPNTMRKAVMAIAGLGVEMFTVHASAGIDAMKMAWGYKGKSSVVAITVLSSLGENDVQSIFSASIKGKVLEFVKDARRAGADSIICSAKELKAVSEYLSDIIHSAQGINSRAKAIGSFYRIPTKITAGIRPEWASMNDQKRVMTPYDAIKAGADYLVIGRPITQPPKEIGTPVQAARRIIEEISAAESMWR